MGRILAYAVAYVKSNGDLPGAVLRELEQGLLAERLTGWPGGELGRLPPLWRGAGRFIAQVHKEGRAARPGARRPGNASQAPPNGYDANWLASWL